MIADPSGNLWVMRYPEFMEPTASVQLVCPYSPAIPQEGSDWLVLDPEGKPLAEVHTPSRFFVLEIGNDYLLGVHRDSLDVETVALYSLHKPR
jgi:hypothetical protein